MTIDLFVNAIVFGLLGSMVFFPAVVAPTVFKALPPEHAGRFLRQLFPRYYTFIIVASSVAAVLHWRVPIEAGVLAAVALSTLWVRQSLVPKVNAWRDLELAGDKQAGKQFARGHRLSVAINMLQMLLLIAVAIRTK
ncbi:MAG: DUF4149 domain-containing protein [Pseudomonadota bacterium]